LAVADLDLSRSQLKRLIESGDVSVNGAPAKASARLREGDAIEVRIPAPRPARVEPQAIDLDVLFEDSHIIVINKPPGLVVHPAPGHPDGTLVNALLAHCADLAGIGGELRPGIIHRLDKDTSGVMVVTKNDAAHAALAPQFKAHTISRVYLAVVAPPLRDASGTIRTMYGRHPTHRKKFSSKVARGKQAVTRYEVVEQFGDLAALVRCQLQTGRTHQIRVHFADRGSPVLGDPLYGRRGKKPVVAELATQLGRQALHAAELGFDHPVTRERLTFQTDVPADMKRVLEALRGLK